MSKQRLRTPCSFMRSSGAVTPSSSDPARAVIAATPPTPAVNNVRRVCFNMLHLSPRLAPPDSTVAERFANQAQQRRREPFHIPLVRRLAVPEGIGRVWVYGVGDIFQFEAVPHHQRPFGNHLSGVLAENARPENLTRPRRQ